MVRLGLPRGPRWLDIGNGVRILARPITTAIYRAATATAMRQATQVAEESGLIEDAGGSIHDLPPLDRDGIEGVRQQFMLQALAQHAIAEWQGVGDEDGNAAAVTPANVAAFIRDFPLHASRFEAAYLREIVELAAEKNDSGAGLNGTTAAAPATAPGATPTAADVVPTTSTPR